MSSKDNAENSCGGILLVVSGSAGAGKGTVISELMSESDEYLYSVSATTRQPRVGEVDGVNYHFLSREAFEKHIADGNVVEYTEYCGNYYGTLKSELEKLSGGKNLILEIEVEGAGNIKKAYPDSVLVFIMPPDYKTLEGRLRGRHTNTEDDIRNRMKVALEEIEHITEYDYIVVNENGKIKEAAGEIINIVKTEKLRSARRSEKIKKEFLSRR